MAADLCLGLRLAPLFWCSFRDPVGSNVHRSFPVPPPATLFGLVGAALGLQQHDYSRRHEMRFAVAVEKMGETVESYSKWMKRAEDAKDATQKEAREAMRQRGLLTPDESLWISTTLIRQKIIQPVFIAGILCSNEVAEELITAFKNPFFPLCLGESDDVVDVEILGLDEPVSTSEAATGTVDGVHAGGTLASLPTRFNMEKRNRWTCEKWLVTVPDPVSNQGISLPGLVECHGQRWHFEPEANGASTKEIAQLSLL